MKLFLVTAYGGDWTGKWECPIAACSSLEVAKELESRVNSNHAKSANIPEDEWESIFRTVVSKYTKVDSTDFVDKACWLFPEYSKEDIAQAYKEYEMSEDDFTGVLIEEIELIETISDIDCSGIIY